LTACLAAFSSTKEFLALNRAYFSSDIAFCAAFKLLANTTNKKDVTQPKRLKERNSERVKGLPSLSASLFFKPTKISAARQQ
jgi:hypothetical protein